MKDSIDQIETIPQTMEKFLWCSGQMIKPSFKTVKSIVNKIDKGSLMTLEQLRAKLAEQNKVETACPASTLKALKAMSNEDNPTCYWRVIKKDGMLISQFSGGIVSHSWLLEKEGF